MLCLQRMATCWLHAPSPCSAWQWLGTPSATSLSASSLAAPWPPSWSASSGLQSCSPPTLSACPTPLLAAGVTPVSDPLLLPAVAFVSLPLLSSCLLYLAVFLSLPNHSPARGTLKFSFGLCIRAIDLCCVLAGTNPSDRLLCCLLAAWALV